MKYVNPEVEVVEFDVNVLTLTNSGPTSNEKGDEGSGSGFPEV